MELAYVDVGTGRPILMLHGFTGTASSHFAALINELSADFRIVAPDLRGFGQSSKPVDGYDKRTVAEDIYQLVQSLGFGKIFLKSNMPVVHCLLIHARGPQNFDPLRFIHGFCRTQ